MQDACASIIFSLVVVRHGSGHEGCCTNEYELYSQAAAASWWIVALLRSMCFRVSCVLVLD